MLTDRDFNIAAKPGQEPHQTFNGHVPKLPVEQPGHVRLTQSHAFGRRDLGQFLRVDGPLNSGHQFGLEQMRLGVGIAEISKNILCAAYDAGISILFHNAFPFPS